MERINVNELKTQHKFLIFTVQDLIKKDKYMKHKGYITIDVSAELLSERLCGKPINIIEFMVQPNETFMNCMTSSTGTHDNYNGIIVLIRDENIERFKNIFDTEDYI